MGWLNGIFVHMNMQSNRTSVQVLSFSFAFQISQSLLHFHLTLWLQCLEEGWAIVTWPSAEGADEEIVKTLEESQEEYKVV